MAEDFECIASFIDYDGKLIAMPAKKEKTALCYMVYCVENRFGQNVYGERNKRGYQFANRI